MSPDVTLNFAANLLLGVGLLLLFPIRRGLFKRVGLVGMAAAAALNIVEMMSERYQDIHAGELLLNCCMAYYVTVLVLEMRSHHQKG